MTHLVRISANLQLFRSSSDFFLLFYWSYMYLVFENCLDLVEKAFLFSCPVTELIRWDLFLFCFFVEFLFSRMQFSFQKKKKKKKITTHTSFYRSAVAHQIMLVCQITIIILNIHTPLFLNVLEIAQVTTQFVYL